MEKQCLRPGEMHTNAQVRNAHKMCKCEMYTKGVSAKWPGASIAGREHSRARASLTSFWFLIGRASIAGRNKDSTKRMTCANPFWIFLFGEQLGQGLEERRSALHVSSLFLGVPSIAEAVLALPGGLPPAKDRPSCTHVEAWRTICEPCAHEL